MGAATFASMNPSHSKLKVDLTQRMVEEVCQRFSNDDCILTKTENSIPHSTHKIRNESPI